MITAMKHISAPIMAMFVIGVSTARLLLYCLGRQEAVIAPWSITPMSGLTAICLMILAIAIILKR